MIQIICRIKALHDSIFATLENALDPKLMPLIARIVFSSVLMVFFLNSAATKVGSGFPGILIPGPGAYAQMLPPIAEAAGYDPSAIALFPWKLIVLFGTYSEFLLPIMLFLGVFTRITSVGLIGFIFVMSFVDVQFHGLDAKSIGMMFDRVQDGVIFDQRLLWLFPLIYLAVKGGGPISVDSFLSRLSARAQ